MGSAKANLKGKSILFIAYFYPPVKSTEVPGAMRTIKFVRNLTAGKCHVMTTPPKIDEKDSALSHLKYPISGEQIHRIDTWDMFNLMLSLRGRVKSVFRRGNSSPGGQVEQKPNTFKSLPAEEKNISVSRFQQLKDFIYNLCYFPDQAAPWILPAYLKGKKIIHEHKIDAIFATGSPWSGLLVGYLISKATKKPLIADFRDPWMNNPFHQSKGKRLDRWSAKLERKVVEHASAISLNTEPLMEEFLERYPHIAKDLFFVMPNGFDRTDFEEISSSQTPPQKGRLTFCHAGFLYGVRDPAVLLDAIRLANSSLEAEGRFIQFKQIGDVELAYDIRERYSDMMGNGSLVLEPSRPYKECLVELRDADWVVNVQPATRSQVPSKLYDYLAIDRPILNITPEDGALGRLVTKYNLGELFGFDDTHGLAKGLVKIARSNEEDEFEGYESKPKFDCASIAEVLAERIKRIT